MNIGAAPWSGVFTGEVVTPLYCRRETQSDPAPLTTSRTFCGAAKICREFLSTFLAGPVLDSLSESARLAAATPSLPLGKVPPPPHNVWA